MTTAPGPSESDNKYPIADSEEELEQLHRDIDIELRAEDFCAFLTLYTVWGQKPQ
jgi:hypothetical protein